MELELPSHVVTLEPRRSPPLEDVPGAIAQALCRPIGTVSLEEMLRARRRARPEASAVVVVSDSTRPVPYTGSSGILLPVVTHLTEAGFRPSDITILVATGTHRPLREEEIGTLFDRRVLEAGIEIRCHDAFDRQSLTAVGRTAAGVEVLMDRKYVEADVRILTGLVESHLMAGASGGRKSICPGLLGIESIRDFHGPRVLADPRSADLVLHGNPCHGLSLEIARMAPADFILNVAVREDGAVTGVYAGDMEQAHDRAVEELRRTVTMPMTHNYDVVVTHAGKVGVNHYQAAKAAAVAAKAVRPDGYVVLVANTTDPDPIGSMHYRALMTLLKDIGHEAYERLIRSPDWTFVPDQWQTQMWSRVLARIPPSHLLYFSPQTPAYEYDRLPCRRPPTGDKSRQTQPFSLQIQTFVSDALRTVAAETSEPGVIQPHDAGERSKTRAGAPLPLVAFLPAGPYGIPVEARNEAAH